MYMDSVVHDRVSGGWMEETTELILLLVLMTNTF